MAISRRLLSDDEHVVVSTRTHVKALLGPAIWLIVVAAVAGFLSTMPTGKAAPLLVAVIWILAFLVACWLVFAPFLRWMTTTYTVTNRRLITRTGILSRRGHDIPLPRINDVAYEHGIIDRMFGCGTLVISDASERGSVVLHDIPQVEQVHLKISDLVFGHASGGGRSTRRHAVSMTGPDQEFTSEQLEKAILGNAPGLTSDDVAESAGVSVEQARRLWRALGFPDAGAEQAFTDADLDALTTLVGAVHKGAIDFDTAVRLTRAVGQTIGRLADWQVATLAPRVEQLESGDDATGSRIGSALRLVDEVGVPFEQLLIYAWRRHLAAAVGRIEALGAADEDLHTTQVTVGFADLVSFTALSNEMDEDRIGDLVEVFESRCADVVAARHGRVIKTLGDSVLFVSEDPVRAMDIALSIVDVIGHDKRLPDVRIGMATGSVVMRMGDVFGPPVNMAARLTGVARRNRVITDPTTADLLPVAQFETRDAPAAPAARFRGGRSRSPYAGTDATSPARAGQTGACPLK